MAAVSFETSEGGYHVSRGKMQCLVSVLQLLKHGAFVRLRIKRPCNRFDNLLRVFGDSHFPLQTSQIYKVFSVYLRRNAIDIILELRIADECVILLHVFVNI